MIMSKIINYYRFGGGQGSGLMEAAFTALFKIGKLITRFRKATKGIRSELMGIKSTENL